MPGGSLSQQVAVWRKRLKEGQADLRSYFENRPATAPLLRRHSKLVDEILIEIWSQSDMPPSAALVAVGGYAREELFPQSDVDILILLEEEDQSSHAPTLELLIGLFWDVGFAIGHSVRTLPECLAEAAGDITVQTNLMEARFVSGNLEAFVNFSHAVANTIQPLAFLEAKVREQAQRHARYNDTAYNLEPNLKESPGGLRDLQNILWIAGGAGVGMSWNALVRDGLLSFSEARQIRQHERQLQNLRIRLHFLANRREDRLLFDHQNALASQLGLKKHRRRASEQLMQRYYRSAKFISVMNEILIQALRERLNPDSGMETQGLEGGFFAKRNVLEIPVRQHFIEHTEAIFECFLTMQRHPELQGMSVATVRALWQARNLVDHKFRSDPQQRQRFMEILRQPTGIIHNLRRMHRYGILGRYIPAFGRITGQMQHDLFHVYTVDEHILNVLRNLRRFTLPEHAHEFPFCSKLMSGFERPETLYVAALFHDIAKGRGGDHSSLGAMDARRFCRQHALSPDDTDLVTWLVANHLRMSSTAQQQDIGDPDVIASFARLVGDERHLTALYLLTVADIRGTSPNVWNAWKSRLLENLFNSSLRHLRGYRPDIAEEIGQRQEQALEILAKYSVFPPAVQPLWTTLDDQYFLRNEGKDIAWHTRLLLTHVKTHQPIVRTRLSPGGDGIQVMIYTPDRNDLFERICGFFERLDYSIVEARIHTTRSGHALDNFLILDESDRSIRYSGLLAHIEKELTELIEVAAPMETPPAGRINRRLKHFPIPPSVTLSIDDKTSWHVLSLVAGDRPGLLSRVAQILLLHGAALHTARINTLGGRAEDTFMVSGPNSKPLSQQKAVNLRLGLLEALGN